MGGQGFKSPNNTQCLKNNRGEWRGVLPLLCLFTLLCQFTYSFKVIDFVHFSCAGRFRFWNVISFRLFLGVDFDFLFILFVTIFGFNFVFGQSFLRNKILYNIYVYVSIVLVSFTWTLTANLMFLQINERNMD